MASPKAVSRPGSRAGDEAARAFSEHHAWLEGDHLRHTTDRVGCGPEILDLQQIVRKLPVSDHVGRYAVNLARASRPDDDTAPDFTREFVTWGCGTRAVQSPVAGLKTWP